MNSIGMTANGYKLRVHLVMNYSVLGIYSSKFQIGVEIRVDELHFLSRAQVSEYIIFRIYCFYS